MEPPKVSYLLYNTKEVYISPIFQREPVKEFGKTKISSLANKTKTQDQVIFQDQVVFQDQVIFYRGNMALVVILII